MRYSVSILGKGGRDLMVVGFTTTCPVSVTTKVVRSNPVHGKVYYSNNKGGYFDYLPYIGKFRVMVFNATFNNISAILWQSVLLVAET
jgi:hypothetical protein